MTDQTPETALAEIATLKGDRQFGASLAAGDAAAAQRWSDLHRLAYPEPGQPAPSAAPATGVRMDVSPDPSQADLGRELAKDYKPPASPASYTLSSPMPDLELNEQAVVDLAGTLHDLGVPPMIANAAFKDGLERIARNGGPLTDDQLESGRETCLRFLERKLGADGMKETLDLARSVIGPAVKKHPQLAEWLTESGEGNNPLLIMQLANWARAKR
ncbi:MAG: hypothetical protein KIT81_06965 [Alphaproteobacteria bacterium]|nr:hypothetical protein [Alphaproteobacteria bacterium]